MRVAALDCRRVSYSNELHAQLPSDGLCGAGERAERHGFVGRVEKPVKLRAARLHTFSQFRLGKALVFHEDVKLAGDHALDGARRHLFVNALLLQKVVKGRADAAFLFHVTSFLRFAANSRSECSVFCVLLVNACRSSIRPSWMENRTR